MSAHTPKKTCTEPRIQVVHSLSALFNADFGPANCVLYPRTLTGDFNALAENFHELYADDTFPRFLGHKDLKALLPRLKAEAVVAAEHVISDMKDLRRFTKSDPSLRVIGRHGYSEINYRWHADLWSTPVGSPQSGRILCAYNLPVTDWVRNEDATYLEDNIVYKLKPGAEVLTFRPGDMFRISCRDNARVVEPFIHRAPAAPSKVLRLLLTD